MPYIKPMVDTGVLLSETIVDRAIAVCDEIIYLKLTFMGSGVTGWNSFSLVCVDFGAIFIKSGRLYCFSSVNS